MGVVTPLTVLLVQQLGDDQVRMAQGLLGVVRSIGGVLGVTVTSVVFERRRLWHQLSAYDAYDVGSVAHYETLTTIKSFLHNAGILGGSADQAALGVVRRQMNIEAIALAFQDSFLLMACCFLFASFPVVYLMVRYRLQS